MAFTKKSNVSASSMDTPLGLSMSKDQVVSTSIDGEEAVNNGECMRLCNKMRCATCGSYCDGCERVMCSKHDVKQLNPPLLLDDDDEPRTMRSMCEGCLKKSNARISSGLSRVVYRCKISIIGKRKKSELAVLELVEPVLGVEQVARNQGSPDTFFSIDAGVDYLVFVHAHSEVF
jgi:hypothetical protein